jgi:hypothetical protein
MHSYQWFLLGVMAAWTPGLIILALLLSHHFHEPTNEIGE